MAISVLELFKVGIGPSSSHTVGPMIAARRFAQSLANSGELGSVVRVKVELYGSLGATGKGHGSDKAVMLGLEGEQPDTIDTDAVPARIARIAAGRRLDLLGAQAIEFDPANDLEFHRQKVLPFHPNAMRFHAFATDGASLAERVYYSVGGGFVADESAAAGIAPDKTALRWPFESGAELLAISEREGLSISSVMLENEQAWRPESATRSELVRIWEVMRACIERGCEREGILPGGLRVKRRAAALHRKLKSRASVDPLDALDWVNLWALAVNEENAAGGRVVTAPTNGAAGIVPAVLAYHQRFCGKPDPDTVARFLLTAAAIGTLFKINASISGAEVGCQGEVGVACSMAAAGLTEVLGGTPAQVENAAEIGMEHNLGLTCDPVGGLVQVPCIERNAMGSVKAINAARLALQGDGTHKVSLDRVIETMRQTGADMKTKYKETSRGGLAVNVIEC
jgi:L-serine dehydratase